MNSKTMRPIAAAIGASFLAMGVVPIAGAETNPFAATQLSAGYELASADKSGTEGKCGEAKCGGSKAGSADKSDTAEGKCGGSKAGSADKSGTAEGKCGGSKADSTAKSEKAEGKCGEGKCGG